VDADQPTYSAIWEKKKTKQGSSFLVRFSLGWEKGREGGEREYDELTRIFPHNYFF
jgi:hypothetical protein